jgi:hypothetical protein
MAANLEQEVELAERLDAFVSRFRRLQDTVGDKLLPQYLDAVGEATGPAIDNLNRMEKLGLIDSAELWMTLRDLRNPMIHEYIEDADAPANALNKADKHVGQHDKGCPTHTGRPGSAGLDKRPGPARCSGSVVPCWHLNQSGGFR